MNRKVKPMLAVAILAMGLLLIAEIAAAQQRGRKFGAGRASGGHRPGSERLLEALDLSEAQQTAIQEIRDEGRAERLSLRKELMRLRNEMHGEMLADEPQQAKVLSLNERIGKARIQMQASRLKERLAVRRS